MSLLIGINDVWHELGGQHNGVSAEKFETIYNMMIDEILEALPNIKIMILEPFVLEGTATASYWLRDGVHPTDMGHWLIKNEWIKAFHKIDSMNHHE